MKREYHEGPEAAKRFEDTVMRVFRAPESSAKHVSKKQSVRTPKETRTDIAACLALTNAEPKCGSALQ